VWEQFTQQFKDVMNCYHGNQDWISEKAVSVETWPASWIVPFKKQCHARDKQSWGMIDRSLRTLGLLKPKGDEIIPKRAKVIYSHAKPDPEDVAYGMWKKGPWILTAWRER
jgi:hypothetical protein